MGDVTVFLLLGGFPLQLSLSEATNTNKTVDWIRKLLLRHQNGRSTDLFCHHGHSGRMSVSGRRTFSVLRSTCPADETNLYRSANQANSPFHPFGDDKWVVSCLLSCTVGAI